MYSTVTCANRDSAIFSSLLGPFLFPLLVLLLWLCFEHSIEKERGSGQPSLVPQFRGVASSLSAFRMALAVGFIFILYYVEVCSL